VAVREVLRHPHPLLTRVAEPADPETAARVAADLLDTMRAFPRCVGVAAPQIGEPVRVAVVDCSQHPKATEHHGELVLVDPVIVARSGGEEAGGPVGLGGRGHPPQCPPRDCNRHAPEGAARPSGAGSRRVADDRAAAVGHPGGDHRRPPEDR